MGGVGFTGTRRGMTVPQERSVANLLQRLHKGPRSEFHYGMEEHADTSAARIASNLGYRLIGHPGPAPYTRLVPHETREQKDNLVRNSDIVKECGILLAAPFGDGEVLRSGTWATVRRARNVGRPHIIVWPDGSWDGIGYEGNPGDYAV